MLPSLVESFGLSVVLVCVSVCEEARLAAVQQLLTGVLVELKLNPTAPAGTALLTASLAVSQVR